MIWDGSMNTNNLVEVFYAYASEDETWVLELEKHLSLLKRQKFISTWHPRLIKAGEDWQRVTETHFQNASIILLLISPDFLASDYCYGTEMKQALEREREKGVCVIPILLRPVDWRRAPFAHLSPLPSDSTFLAEWPNLDRAFVEVTTGIRRAIENLSLLTASLIRTDFPNLWNVPYPRNLFFVGRTEVNSWYKLFEKTVYYQTLRLSIFSKKPFVSPLRRPVTRPKAYKLLRKLLQCCYMSCYTTKRESL